MRRIDDTKLLELLDSGKTQAQTAEYFGVSPAAVCKRLKKICPQQEPESFVNLSQKNKTFALALVAGKSKTAAAQDAFDVTSRESAQALGSRLARDPDIQLAICDLLAQEGLSKRYRIRKVKTHVDSLDPSISLKALDMAFKLAGNYVEKHVHVGMTLEDYCEQTRNLQKELDEVEKEIAELEAEIEGAEIVEQED